MSSIVSGQSIPSSPEDKKGRKDEEVSESDLKIEKSVGHDVPASTKKGKRKLPHVPQDKKLKPPIQEAVSSVAQKRNKALPLTPPEMREELQSSPEKRKEIDEKAKNPKFQKENASLIKALKELRIQTIKDLCKGKDDWEIVYELEDLNPFERQELYSVAFDLKNELPNLSACFKRCFSRMHMDALIKDPSVRENSLVALHNLVSPRIFFEELLSRVEKGVQNSDKMLLFAKDWAKMNSNLSEFPVEVMKKLSEVAYKGDFDVAIYSSLTSQAPKFATGPFKTEDLLSSAISGDKQSLKLLASEFRIFQQAVHTPISLGCMLGEKNEALEGNKMAFDKIAGFVSSTILTTLDPKERRETVKMFIDLAQECYDTGDLASVQAIISGLSKMPVYRLEGIKDLFTYAEGGSEKAPSIGVAYGDTLKKLSPIITGAYQKQMDMIGPFVEKHPRPIIPEGVFTSALTLKVEEKFPSVSDGELNVQKLKGLCDVLEPLNRAHGWMKEEPIKQPQSDLCNMILESPGSEADNSLYLLSYALQQSDTTDITSFAEAVKSKMSHIEKLSYQEDSKEFKKIHKAFRKNEILEKAFKSGIDASLMKQHKWKDMSNLPADVGVIRATARLKGYAFLESRIEQGHELTPELVEQAISKGIEGVQGLDVGEQKKGTFLESARFLFLNFALKLKGLGFAIKSRLMIECNRYFKSADGINHEKAIKEEAAMKAIEICFKKDPSSIEKYRELKSKATLDEAGKSELQRLEEVPGFTKIFQAILLNSKKQIELLISDGRQEELNEHHAFMLPDIALDAIRQKAQARDKSTRKSVGVTEVEQSLMQREDQEFLAEKHRVDFYRTGTLDEKLMARFNKLPRDQRISFNKQVEKLAQEIFPDDKYRQNLVVNEIEAESIIRFNVEFALNPKATITVFEPDLYATKGGNEARVHLAIAQASDFIDRTIGKDRKNSTPEKIGLVLEFCKPLLENRDIPEAKKLLNEMKTLLTDNLYTWGAGSPDKKVTNALQWIFDPKNEQTLLLNDLLGRQNVNDIREQLFKKEYAKEGFINLLKQANIEPKGKTTLSEITAIGMKLRVNPLEVMVHQLQDDYKNAESIGNAGAVLIQFSKDLPRDNHYMMSDGAKNISNAGHEGKRKETGDKKYIEECAKEINAFFKGSPQYAKLAQALSTQTMGNWIIGSSIGGVLQSLQRSGNVFQLMNPGQIVEINVERDSQGAITGLHLKTEYECHLCLTGEKGKISMMDFGLKFGFDATFTIDDKGIPQLKGEPAATYEPFGLKG